MTPKTSAATAPRSRPSSVVSIEARSQQNSGYLAVTRSVKRTAAAHFVEPARISSAVRVPRRPAPRVGSDTLRLPNISKTNPPRQMPERICWSG